MKTKIIFLLVVVGLTLAALTNTYDTATPDGSVDDPKDGDNRIRETTAAIQERMNDHNGTANEGDHYWPLTGTNVSNIDTGQHRMVTLRQMAADPDSLTSYSTITNLGFLYQKDVSGNGEFFYEDEASNVLQMTSGGDLHSSENFTMLTGKTATIETIIAVDSTGLLLQNDTPATVITVGDDGTATLADSSQLATAAAPTADADIANKKYVDDQDTADHPAYSGGESHTDGSGLITKMGRIATGAATGTHTYGAAFPNGTVAIVTGIEHPTAASNEYTAVTAYDNNGFDWKVLNTSTDIHWIAKGY